MEQTTKGINFFPALDGLRGIAIISVIFYHNFPGDKFFFGWLGVDLFFVLSGFLITSILINSIRTDCKVKYFKNFYLRRILRIFPLYYLFLLFFLFIFPTLGILKSDVSEYQTNKWWFVFYLQNWLFINDFPLHSNCLNHFWSLAVEEQFYILWPPVIFLLRKTRTLILFLVAIMILLFSLRCYLWSLQIPDFNYTNFYTFTRIDGICMGSIVALIVEKSKSYLSDYRPIIISVLALLNFTFYFVNKSGSLPYLAFIGYTTFTSIFAVVVYELTHGHNLWLKKIFSLTPLRFIGKISYGLYMFHWPIHYFLSTQLNLYISNTFPINTTINALLTSIITTSISIIISSFSYYYFESYFFRIKKKFY